VDSPLLRFILESNNLREAELKDPRIAEETYSVKSIWSRFRKAWYYDGTT
jgi:hypothetical protein